VVTYLVDRDGRVWTVADIMPGGAARAAAAGDGIVALGEAAISHRALARGGLVVTGATSSDAGALGAGKAVKAVRAAGAAWTEAPLAALWDTPLEHQVRRSFAALVEPIQDRTAGADLLFLSGEVLGVDGDGVLVALSDGTTLVLGVPSEHAALPYRDNLRLLGSATGTRLRIVGRPDPLYPQRVHPLAVSTADLALPASWAGRVDLGFDRLTAKHLPGGDGVDVSQPAVSGAAQPAGELALHLVRRHAERVVAGGRAVQALARPDESRLLAARLETGAGLLRALTAAAAHRPRDTFGRRLDTDVTAFAEAWLAVTVYEQAASWTLSEASWLPGLLK
jgi:hypothetical protein